MNYEIMTNGDLKITVDVEEQLELKETRDQNEYFNSDDFMYSTLETLICNSDLDWCEPGWVDALTSAPILAIFGKERRLIDFDTPVNEMNLIYNITGRHTTRFTQEYVTMYQPVEKHWGFMQYEVTSPQEQLANKGYCIWQSGDS